MKNEKTILKIEIIMCLFVLVFSSMIVSAADTTYNINTTSMPTIEYSSGIFSANVSGSEYQFAGLLYELPTTGEKGDRKIQESIVLTYSNAASKENGETRDLRITINDIELHNYDPEAVKNSSASGFSTQKIKYVNIFKPERCSLDCDFITEDFHETGWSTTGVIMEGLRCNVVIEVLGATADETYDFCCLDLDVENYNGNYSDYWYEGMDLISGFSEIQFGSDVTHSNDAITYYDGKVSNCQIRGTKRKNPDTVSGFMATANASKTEFKYIGGGRTCGALLKWQPEIKVEHRLWTGKGNATEQIVSGAPNYTIKLNDLNEITIKWDDRAIDGGSYFDSLGYQYKGVSRDFNNNTMINAKEITVSGATSVVTFWWESPYVIEIEHRLWTGKGDVSEPLLQYAPRWSQSIPTKGLTIYLVEDLKKEIESWGYSCHGVSIGYDNTTMSLFDANQQIYDTYSEYNSSSPKYRTNTMGKIVYPSEDLSKNPPSERPTIDTSLIGIIPTEPKREYNAQNVITFWYTKPSVTIPIKYKDIYHQENEIADGEEKTIQFDGYVPVISPNDEEIINKGYEFYGSSFENGSINFGVKDVGISNTGVTPKSVIFWYGEKPVVTYWYTDRKDPAPVIAELQIIPTDMNNQYIDQNANKYYWVLDEEGTITIRAKIEGEITGNPIAKVTNPFNESDVKSVTLTKKGEYYEGTTDRIKVPIDTPELKEYTIKASLTVANEEVTSEEATATQNITVIGAVYDFSVTNIDGSSTTGDQIWKATLYTKPVLTTLPTYKEYEASALPIGQSSQQNKAYIYGINKGTRFYYSINTKGTASSSIVITPKFYVINGNDLVEVEVKSKGSTYNYGRTISLTDSNRNTYASEYQQERAALGKNAKTTSTISETNKDTGTSMLLGNDFKLPYKNYGSPTTSDATKYHETTGYTDEQKTKYTNHWYGDFYIPIDAKYYNKTTQAEEKGNLVVYFCVQTAQENDGSKPYLAYGLSSPFSTSTSAQSEWKFEKGNDTVTYTLPKTSVGATEGTLVNGWNLNIDKNVFAPVAIYGTQSAKLDSAGTH